MGCANQKLHAQHIAYQRDFLGACWNSALGDEESKEYLASRWMGVSRNVMSQYTNNHCFTVRVLTKEDKSAAEAAEESKGRGRVVPDDPTVQQPGLNGDFLVGAAPRYNSNSTSLTKPGDSTMTGLSSHPSRLVKHGSHSPGAHSPAGSSTTMRLAQGSGGSPASRPYAAGPSKHADERELADANARLAAAERHKKTGSNPNALRAVVKDANALEKATYSHHPYLQRSELSVYGGVVFRSAPARRLYHRIAFVPAARAKRLNNAPLLTSTTSAAASAGAAAAVGTAHLGDVSGDGANPTSTSTDPKTRGDVPAASSSLANNTTSGGGGPPPPPSIALAASLPVSSQLRPQRSPLSTSNFNNNSGSGSGAWSRRSPRREADRGNAGGGADGATPTLSRTPSIARRGRSGTGNDDGDAITDPLSGLNNYPIDDRDAPGSTTTRPPVVIGSITAMELQALPPNAELCFGGWLYVSLQDEQERLRRSLARYDERRQRHRATLASTSASHISKSRTGAGLAARDDSDEDGELAFRSRRQTSAMASTTLSGTALPSPQTPAVRQATDEGVEQQTHGPLRRQRSHSQASVTSTLENTSRPSPQPVSERGDDNDEVNASDEAGASSQPAPPRRRQRARSAPPTPPSWLATPPPPAASPSVVQSTLRAGRYAEEAMAADALAAAWLPYAYIIVAIPMYECSLVPTTFHAALTRHKAVSLNLANAQSRQAYGVGCITAARYGGVMVVEYRDKVEDDEDANWIDELLRVGHETQERYGGGQGGGSPAPSAPHSYAAGSDGASACVTPSRGRPSQQPPTPRPRRYSHTATHQARAEKLRHIQARIGSKLRRQGLHVVVAATRTADRRRRQGHTSAASDLNLLLPQPPITAAAAATTSQMMVGAGATGGEHNAADDSDSDSDASGSSDSHPRGGAGDGSWDENTSRRRKSGLWSRLSRSGGSRGHHHHHHHHHRGGGGDAAGDRAGGSGADSSAAAEQHQRRPWTEPGLVNDDFLLRGTFRQIGGMKYLDAVSLMDGCHVSELVQGIKRWVVNLLSMPIKARPLSLYLQRYEGIASSLRLLNSQLTSAAQATSVASGRLIAPSNLSFHAGGLDMADVQGSFVGQQSTFDAPGYPASTGSPSTASFALVNASFAAAGLLPTAPRGHPYNTFYNGPLEPVVRAVLSPEIEATIAACQARQLPEVLQSPETRAAAAAAALARRDPDMGTAVPRAALMATVPYRNGSGSASSQPDPQLLPSVSSRRTAAVSELPALKLSPAMSPSTLPHGALPPCINEHGRPIIPMCVAALGSSAATAPAHVDPSAPLTPPFAQARIASPRGSFAVPSADTAAAAAAAASAPSAPPPAPVPTTITECLLYDDPSRNGSFEGNSFTAANGRVLAAAAATMLCSAAGGSGGGGGGVANGSFANGLAGPGVEGVGGGGVHGMGTGTPSPSFRFNTAGSFTMDPRDRHGAAGDARKRPAKEVEVEVDRTEVGGSDADAAGSDDGDKEMGGCGKPEAHLIGTPCKPRRAAGVDAEKGTDSDGDDLGGDKDDDEDDDEQRAVEAEWQLADRELRALKSELDEMHYLVSTAREELLGRLEECIQLGAIFLPHTRSDEVALSLLTVKMMRQYPEEVPVKEIHTDWVPMLMTLLTSSRDHFFCCAGYDGGNLEHAEGNTWGFLTTYNNAVAAADVCDANRRRELYAAGTTKYTIDPLPPLPVPRHLHDIVIAPQPVRFTRAALRELRRVGIDERGLSFTFSGGSLGVLAGILYYYADFLRAKYHSEVAAVGGRAKDAGQTVEDVLTRGGYNVVLRRVWVWGVTTDATAQKRGNAAVAVAKRTTRRLQRKLPGRDGDDSSSSGESYHSPHRGDADHVVTNTAGLAGGGAQMAGLPFRGTEAYALYDAVVHYLRTLEELAMEHEGNTSIIPSAPARRRSVLAAWRRSREGGEGAGADSTRGGNAKHATAAQGEAAAAAAAVGSASAGAELVPTFEICVASNFYYKHIMEEVRQPPPSRSSGSANSQLSAPPPSPPPPPLAPSSSASTTAAKAAKAAAEAARQQQRFEQPYCGGEEVMEKKVPQWRAVKKFFGFLTDHYEQWRARHSDDRQAAAFGKRIHIAMR